MPKIGISTGIGPDTFTGDSLLLGASSINNNFNEIYDYFGDGFNLSFTGTVWESTSLGITTTKNVGINTQSPSSTLHVVGNSLFSGIVTSSLFSGNLSGTATTAVNLENASNITTGTINPNRLTGTYNIDISGIADNASYSIRSGEASLSEFSLVSAASTLSLYSDLAGISTYSDSAGISTYSDSAGISTYSEIAGIASFSSYASVAGIATLGANYANVSGFSTYSEISGIASYSNLAGISSYSNTSEYSNYSNNSGIATYAILSGITSALQTPINISIGGSFITSPTILFDGSDNVSLSATITHNSIDLGIYATGNYVKKITNGSYIIGADGGDSGSELILGVDAAVSNTPSKIVARDAFGDFSARQITANILGTATTAINLEDAGNINTGVIDSARLNGTYNISIIGSSSSSDYSSSSGLSTYSNFSGYSDLAGISTYSDSAGISTYSNLAGISTYSDLAGISTYSNFSGISSDVVGGIASVTSLEVSGISTFTGISTHTQSIFGTNLFLSGISSANVYYGSGIGLTNVPAESLSGSILPSLDGSNLYNITGLGVGVEVRNNDVTVGTASTINFVGSIVSFSSGIATITSSIGGGGGESYWVSTDVGIHTLSSVGIGTTNPIKSFTVFGDSYFSGRIEGIADYSLESNYSDNSGISSISIYSNFSGYSDLAGISTYSNFSGYSDLAGISTYSDSAGISTYSEIAGISSSVSGFEANVDYLNINRSAIFNSGFFDTTITVIHNSVNPFINAYNQLTDTSLLKITNSGLVGIGSSDPTSKLTVDGDAIISGVVTASVFVGDGSGLTGVTAQGSGVVIRDDNNLVGIAATINFGENLIVSQISSGIVTVSSTTPWLSAANRVYNLESNIGIGTSVPFERLHVLGNILVTDGELIGNSSSSTYSLYSGISTESINSTNVIGGIGSISSLKVSGITTTESLNVSIGQTAVITTTTEGLVGIGTTFSRGTLDISGDLFVKSYSLTTGIGTFDSSPGIPVEIDSFSVDVSTENFQTIEYTINVGHGTNFQTQKVLAVQNGEISYSQEYAIIFHPNLIVSVGSTIVTTTSSEGPQSFFTLNLIPESGISGLTTYKFVRGGLL